MPLMMMLYILIASSGIAYSEAINTSQTVVYGS